MVKDGSKLTIDEAKKRKGKPGLSDEKFEDLINEKTDEELFTDLRVLRFSWQEQPGKEEDKLMSRIPNGKICFVDKSEDPGSVSEGAYYICAVNEVDNVAFAKIICEDREPKIYILPNNNVTMVWYNKDKEKFQTKMPGPYDSFEERLLHCVKEFRDRGISEAKLIFRENEE